MAKVLSKTQILSKPGAITWFVNFPYRQAVLWGVPDAPMGPDYLNYVRNLQHDAGRWMDNVRR